MIIRRDLRPNPTPVPKELTDACRQLGGTNPFGENLYRVIRAEDRITQAAGEWNVWSDEVPVEDRGNLGIGEINKRLYELREVTAAAERAGFEKDEIRKIARDMEDEMDGIMQDRLRLCPVKVIRGMDDIPLYPFEGWMIEKWRPASFFGVPAQWEAFKFEGSNALGGYPHQGEYEYCAGPTPYPLTKRDIEDAIRQDLKNIQERPQHPRERVFRMMQKLEQRQQQKERERKNKIESILKDSPAKLYNRLSLGAGRVIQDLADKAGLKGHFGA